jgi:hypothetical protein
MGFVFVRKSTCFHASISNREAIIGGAVNESKGRSQVQ